MLASFETRTSVNAKSGPALAKRFKISYNVETMGRKGKTLFFFRVFCPERLGSDFLTVFIVVMGWEIPLENYFLTLLVSSSHKVNYWMSVF